MMNVTMIRHVQQELAGMFALLEIPAAQQQLAGVSITRPLVNAPLAHKEIHLMAFATLVNFSKFFYPLNRRIALFSFF